jgi:hypothetical protein
MKDGCESQGKGIRFPKAETCGHRIGFSLTESKRTDLIGNELELLGKTFPFQTMQIKITKWKNVT